MAVKERIEGCKDQLIVSNDPNYDRLLKGMIRAYSEFLSVRMDETPDLISIEEAE